MIAGNPVGFPSPPINPPDPGPEGQTGVSPIPDDIYEGEEFSFTLTYQCFTTDGENETLIPTSVEFTSYNTNVDGLTCTQLNSTTLKISGIALNVFTDAYYKFLMQDNSVKILPANTTEKYKALIEWSIPENKIAPINHTISAKVTNLQDATFSQVSNTLTHDAYWKLESAIAQFRTILSKGTI